MKTTINIPDDKVDALLSVTKSKTRTEAIIKAIDDYLYRARLAELNALAGSWEGSGAREAYEEVERLETKESLAAKAG